jgi:hypothetical protein
MRLLLISLEQIAEYLSTTKLSMLLMNPVKKRFHWNYRKAPLHYLDVI